MNYIGIFKQYWQFVRKYRYQQIILLIGYALAAIAANNISPLIYKKIIDSVSINPPGVYQELTLWLIALAITIVFYNICFRVSDYYINLVQSKITRDLTDYSLDQLQRHSYTFFSNAFTGGLVAKTKRFVNAFETLHDQFVFQIWMNGISLLGVLAVLWYQSAILGLIFLIWLVLYGILIRFLIKWQENKNLLNAEADSKTTAHYSDIISNILTVKIFGASKREKDNFSETTSEQEKKRTAAWLQTGFWNNTFQSAAIGLFGLAIISAAVILWEKGVVTAGTIVLVQVYEIIIFGIVWNISRNIIKASTAMADADEMIKIFEQESGVKDIGNPAKLNIQEGRIEFKDVSFTYNELNPAFKNLNLTIKSGEKIALVGHSGAGKSTIVKLLLRFLDIQRGAILIDGQNIAEVTQEDLRNQISYVPQEPILFHRSLRENIAYARPDASMEKIIDVAKRAHAHEFIDKLPEKYESMVGERGIKLSGGERQRIAIARAMLKDVPIIVLDEATSSLDSLSEVSIQNAFEELMKGKTTIVIAHRLSTIRKMDRIIVLDKGNIVESGSHDDLIKKEGIYKKLWDSQIGGFIVE